MHLLTPTKACTYLRYVLTFMRMFTCSFAADKVDNAPRADTKPVVPEGCRGSLLHYQLWNGPEELYECLECPGHRKQLHQQETVPVYSTALPLPSLYLLYFKLFGPA